MASTKQVVQVIYHHAQILDITGPMEVFAQANEFLNRNVYELCLVSHTRGPVTMSSGLKLVADLDFADVTKPETDIRPDTLLVAGGNGSYTARHDPSLIEFIRQQRMIVRRIASVCSGTFILAQAGLLKGKRATTHWEVCERLALEYPDILVEPDKIYIRDGKLYSSAGVTAGIDLALALVQEDCGRETALHIAKQLVVFMKRQGGQSQFSSSLAQQSASRGILKETIEWIRSHPSKDLSVSSLARRSAMSERNFSRVFKREIGMTPGKFVEKMRVEFAAREMENSPDGFKQIAADCGFSNEEMMRKAFKRQLKVVPFAYRKRFGT